MRILAADDERLALSALEDAIRKAAPEAEVFPFRRPEELLAFAAENRCDIAFLDIEMRGMDGVELAKRLKRLYSDINIIFVTGYSQYAGSAFELHASGYLLKPVTSEKIELELSELRRPPTPKSETLLKVQCFGNFEVLAKGVPLHFERSRTKELLAYLIDRRGAAVNTGELCAVLWEDRPDSQSLRKHLRILLSDLSKTLQEAGAESVFLKHRNSFAVDTKKLDCDYYDYLRDDTGSPGTYNGEYMSQYSWAEMTLGRIAGV